MANSAPEQHQHCCAFLVKPAKADVVLHVYKVVKLPVHPQARCRSDAMKKTSPDEKTRTAAPWPTPSQQRHQHPSSQRQRAGHASINVGCTPYSCKCTPAGCKVPNRPSHAHASTQQHSVHGRSVCNRNIQLRRTSPAKSAVRCVDSCIAKRIAGDALVRLTSLNAPLSQDSYSTDIAGDTV